MADWIWYLALIPAGFAAGIINTIAGGGSFLTLPALMFVCGIDLKVANATNRVAILLSSASATATFAKHGHLDRKLAIGLAVPTLLGVPVGAIAAIRLSTSALEPIFGVLFLAMAIVILSNPKRFVSQGDRPEKLPRWGYLVFFAIGVYVGFIQAGMGILLLVSMQLVATGDLVQSNAIKNLIGFVVTLVAVIVFVSLGTVYWLPGLLMAAGNLAGGIAGAKLAIAKGNRLVLAVLLTVMTATGIKLLWPVIGGMIG
ncbi:MAG TPA: sulfite exporter TauE/SafE family protein [Planctomycetaceae bacterium]|nr:sulfite exporter TauE/SafE family protein [Planctomycetaceae bacterium]